MSKTTSPTARRPSKAVSAQAKRSLDALRKRASVSVGGATPPAAAVVALERVLEVLAEGGGVAVMPLDAEISTQEAADLLGVSRPTLIKLLDQGVIPFHTLDVHRRLIVSDVVAYRATRDAQRRLALDDIAAENQRLGLYDD
jgi:excisionase family DNA binding protein